MPDHSPSRDAGSNARVSERSASGVRRRVILLTSLATAILIGVLIGAGAFTFVYGNGTSYLSNDPKTCLNCHVMQESFDSWQNSSHHHVALCNDCHLPHDFVGKWVSKADNGLFHSIAFTFQDYQDPIQIKPRNRTITQNACIDCHKDFVHSLLTSESLDWDTKSNHTLCVHCHSEVGHAFRPYSSGSRRE
ncbi:MAG: cytochrome c nitrite reductase small subunit [Planctomycetota bacterium]